ncbi:hypothetical protein Tco_1128744, partial [Tanacetum coccineum]
MNKVINIYKMIMLDSYTSSMCLQSWGRINYPRALIDIRVDRELNEDMVVAIPNVKDDGEVLHTVRVEYEWEPPRCGVCMVFGHDDMLCQNGLLKNLRNNTLTMMLSNILLLLMVQMWVPRKVTSTNNHFDALNTIEGGDELGSNEVGQIQ